MLEKENFFGNKRARQEVDSSGLDLHFSNLHDEDVDQSGERVDWATGEPYDNSSDDPGAQKLTIVEPKYNQGDILPPLPPEDDEAAEWLKKHAA